MYDMPNVCGKLFKKKKIIIIKIKKWVKNTDERMDNSNKNNGEFIKNEQFLLDFPKEFRF